jgi:hypothetical protein
MLPLSSRPTSLVSVLRRLSDLNLWLVELDVAEEEFERKSALIKGVVRKKKKEIEYYLLLEHLS